MEVFEALLDRRTVHNYQPGEVPNQVIARAIEAANCAPNHHNTHPWKFYQLSPKVRGQLVELAIDLKSKDQALSETKKQALAAKYKSPGAIFTINRQESSDPVRAREDYAAVAMALQNFFLVLHAEGFGSKWSTGKLAQSEKLYEWLRVDPKKEKIEGLLFVGVPERVPAKPQKPSVESVWIK